MWTIVKVLGKKKRAYRYTWNVYTNKNPEIISSVSTVFFFFWQHSPRVTNIFFFMCLLCSVKRIKFWCVTQRNSRMSPLPRCGNIYYFIAPAHLHLIGTKYPNLCAAVFLEYLLLCSYSLNFRFFGINRRQVIVNSCSNCQVPCQSNTRVHSLNEKHRVEIPARSARVAYKHGGGNSFTE